MRFYEKEIKPVESVTPKIIAEGNESDTDSDPDDPDPVPNTACKKSLFRPNQESHPPQCS